MSYFYPRCAGRTMIVLLLLLTRAWGVVLCPPRRAALRAGGADGPRCGLVWPLLVLLALVAVQTSATRDSEWECASVCELPLVPAKACSDLDWACECVSVIVLEWKQRTAGSGVALEGYSHACAAPW